MKNMVPSLVLCAFVVSGCAAIQGFSGVTPPDATSETLPSDLPLPAAETVTTQTLDPTPPPPPSASANTVAALDTTTPQDRADALAAVAEPAGEQRLGTTLATLGAPTDPGIWIKTGLVTELTQGRVEYQGTSINIDLRPSGGAADEGSQISLPAMRLLNAPLTGIVELTVFAGGEA